ncbi:MAG: hypothetical protein ACRD2L_13445 [Terriglobia bacterium]
MFQEALAEILSRLETAQSRGLLTDYALIGGFAVSAWGVPRATQDFDFAIAIGSADPLALATFLGAQYHAGGPDDPLQGVMHVPVEVEGQSIPLQLVVFPSDFTELAFRHVESLSVLGRIVPVVSWQALVLLKLYAGGPQDMLDARQILKVRCLRQDDLKGIAEMAESVGLLNEWTALLNLN